LFNFAHQGKWENVLVYLEYQSDSPAHHLKINRLLMITLQQRGEQPEQIATQLIQQFNARVLDIVWLLQNSVGQGVYFKCYRQAGNNPLDLADLLLHYVGQQDGNNRKNNRDAIYQCVSNLISYLENPRDIVRLIQQLFVAQRTNQTLTSRRGHFSSAFNSHQWQGAKVSTQWVDLVEHAKAIICSIASAEMRNHPEVQNFLAAQTKSWRSGFFSRADQLPVEHHQNQQNRGVAFRH